MLFDLHGNTYKVTFQRNNLLLSSSRCTMVELWIKDGDNFTFLLGAESYCNPKDIFEKSKGRKIALAKLLKDANNKAIFPRLDKEDRVKIWEVYFQEHKKC